MLSDPGIKVSVFSREGKRWKLLHGLSWSNETSRNLATLSPESTPRFPIIPEFFGHDGQWIGRFVDFMIESIEGRVGFVKFQSAYFEACGLAGLTALSAGIKKARAAGIGVILDAKRGDIGATASAYARAYLTPASAGGSGDFEADCLTVNPLMGPDTLEPFVECANRFGKGLFVLCRTSNPGAGWLQDKMTGNRLVSDRLADLIAAMGANANNDSRLNRRRRRGGRDGAARGPASATIAAPLDHPGARSWRAGRGRRSDSLVPARQHARRPADSECRAA